MQYAGQVRIQAHYPRLACGNEQTQRLDIGKIADIPVAWSQPVPSELAGKSLSQLSAQSNLSLKIESYADLAAVENFVCPERAVFPGVEALRPRLDLSFFSAAKAAPDASFSIYGAARAPFSAQFELKDGPLGFAVPDRVEYRNSHVGQCSCQGLENVSLAIRALVTAELRPQLPPSSSVSPAPLAPSSAPAGNTFERALERGSETIRALTRGAQEIGGLAGTFRQLTGLFGASAPEMPGVSVYKAGGMVLIVRGGQL